MSIRGVLFGLYHDISVTKNAIETNKKAQLHRSQSRNKTLIRTKVMTEACRLLMKSSVIFVYHPASSKRCVFSSTIKQTTLENYYIIYPNASLTRIGVIWTDRRSARIVWEVGRASADITLPLLFSLPFLYSTLISSILFFTWLA